MAAAGVAAGSAAAAMPSVTLNVHARLAPVVGTKDAGRFNGQLASSGGPVPGPVRQAAPPIGRQWRLTWKLSLPSLGGPVAASLRLPAESGAAAVARVLCTRCTTTAKGTIKLPESQASRLAGSHGFVVVRTPSATLRGKVQASRAPGQAARLTAGAAI